MHNRRRTPSKEGSGNDALKEFTDGETEDSIAELYVVPQDSRGRRDGIVNDFFITWGERYSRHSGHVI